MKRTIEMITMTLIIIVFAAFVGSTLMGCGSDDGSIIVTGDFHVRDVANSGCKSTSHTRSEYPEYFEFKACDGGYLSVNHVNAMFNCAPGELKIEATIDGNVIKILETEETSLANCICPYDLYCEVGPLGNGDYEVVIYRGSFEIPAHKFSITYNNRLNAKYEVTYNN
jgi:hypothetical protein